MDEVHNTHKMLTDYGIAERDGNDHIIGLYNRVRMLAWAYQDAQVFLDAAGAPRVGNGCLNDQLKEWVQGLIGATDKAHKLLTDLGVVDIDGRGYKIALIDRIEILGRQYQDARTEMVKANQAIGQLAMGAIEALDEVGAPPGPSVPARIKALAEQHAIELAGARLDHADVSSLRALVEQHGHMYGIGGTYDRTANSVNYADPTVVSTDDVVEATIDLVGRLLAEVATKTIERDEARGERTTAQFRLRESQSVTETLNRARLDLATEALALGDHVPSTLRDKILALLRL